MRGGRSSGTAERSRNSRAKAVKRSTSARLEASPSEARTAPPDGRPDRVDVVVEAHALAEVAADQSLARDRERDLAGAGVAEAAGAQRDGVPSGHAIDVALVDDAPVGVQEVKSDRCPAPLDIARPVDRGGGG